MKKRIKVLLIVLVVIEIISTYFMYKSSHNKKIELDKVELRELIDRNSFAVYLDGEEYNGDSFPANSYLDMTKTKCMNEYGEIIASPEITYINNTLTISNRETTYCTLYFNKNKPKIINKQVICEIGNSMSIQIETDEKVSKYYYSLDGSKYEESNDNIYSIQGLTPNQSQKIYAYVKTSDNRESEVLTYEYIPKNIETKTALDLKDEDQITKALVGGMYRYQGTNDVNNWIMFGAECTNEYTKLTDEERIDKYMYRIIGVTPEGELALIKETGVKETGSTNRDFQWNDKYQLTENECGTNGENCTWPLSTLYNRLNGLCTPSNINCTGTGSGYNGQTNIFIGNNYYDYLNSNSTWLEKINTHTWKYGDTTSNGSYNGDTIYEIESKFSNSVQAKIGLQYIHDYYYAYPGGKPGSSSTAKNAWIHFRKDRYNTGITYEWLISRYGVNSTRVNAWHVYSGGNVNSSGLSNGSSGVRPVFYLKSDIPISNTAGSKEEPFMIT